MALFSKKNLNDRHNISQIDSNSKKSVESLEKILDTKLYLDNEEPSTDSSDMDGYIFSIDDFSSVFVKISGMICAFFKMDKNNKRQWVFLSAGPKTLNFKLSYEIRYYTIDYIRHHGDPLKEVLETVEKM